MFNVLFHCHVSNLVQYVLLEREHMIVRLYLIALLKFTENVSQLVSDDATLNAIRMNNEMLTKSDNQRFVLCFVCFVFHFVFGFLSFCSFFLSHCCHKPNMTFIQRVWTCICDVNTHEILQIVSTFCGVAWRCTLDDCRNILSYRFRRM